MRPAVAGSVIPVECLLLATSCILKYNRSMSISLSAELRQALADHPGEPVEFVDEVSHARFVLLPAEQFERIKALLTNDEFDLRETYAAQSAALGAAGWDDPELDIYNDYDANRK